MCRGLSDFAEAVLPLDPAEKIAEQLAKEAAPITDAMINQVRDLMHDVADLSELADRLPELLGDMDIGQLNELMAKAFATAELNGRFEVDNEA